MSVASLGVIGGLAASGLPQRAAEADRVQRETTEQARAAEANQRAEHAAGIGETEEDSQTSERDADGRRIWERPEEARKKPEAASDDAQLVRGKDPSGACGNQLDLVG